MSRLTTKLMSSAVGLSLVAFSFAGVASAQTASPRVDIQLLTSGLTSPLVASTTSATIARLVLDTSASPEAVRLSSIPFILTTGNGAVASTLTNCRVVNESNTSVNLNTAPGNGSGLVSGLNSVVLASPIILPAGTVTTVDLMCDPSAGLVTGGTFTVSMNTSNVSGTGVSSGLPAVIGIRGATPTVPVIPVVVPTVPNTGAGGAAAVNWSLILGSLGLAAVGFSLTRKAVKAR